MMIKTVVGRWSLVVSFLFLLSTSFAQPISSSELINNARQYDGRVVVFEGEVIGDIMKRGDYSWINLTDASNAIGVWINTSLAAGIAYTGSYQAIGDGIEITGVFNRACIQHGGDMDIHAQAMRKTSTGRLLAKRLNPGKRNFVIVLLAILGLVWILSILKRK